MKEQIRENQEIRENQGNRENQKIPVIRPMTAEDVPEAAEIEKKSITPPWSRQGFLEALKQDTLMLVGVLDGKVCGYVNMYLSFEEGEITNVATDPAYRGRKIAWQLMQKAAEEAKERGVERIILEVRASNEPAISLYRKCGFTELGIRKNFYEQPREDARIMEWKLC